MRSLTCVIRHVRLFFFSRNWSCACAFECHWHSISDAGNFHVMILRYGDALTNPAFDHGCGAAFPEILIPRWNVLQRSLPKLCRERKLPQPAKVQN